MKSKYKIGDIVRIKMYNDKTRQNWSDELYKIQKVHKSRKLYSVPYYYISSINNNKIIDKKYSVSFNDEGITLFYGEDDDQYTTEDYNNERSEILNFFILFNDIFMIVSYLNPFEFLIL